MKTAKNPLEALDQFFSQISAEKLNALIEEIDAMGIEGPSVEEYFANITNATGSFLEDLAETATREQVNKFFNDCRIDIGKYKILGIGSISNTSLAPIEHHTANYAGENNYALAA